MKELSERNANTVLHVETGNLLREFIKGNLYIQKIIKNVLDKGELAPESVAIDIWMNYLVTHFTGKEHIIFDGTPRKIVEAHLLDDFLKFFRIPKYKVIYINTSREECTKRLVARQRSDDTTDDIAHRMDWFDTEVIPCVEFFKQDRDCEVIEINGNQSIEAVNAEFIQKVFV